MAQTFHPTDAWYNIIYALDISIEKHLGSLLLKGDLNRIIYSSIEFAFRKRHRTSETQSLDLPFISYKTTAITEGNEQRQWWNNEANTEGIWIEELQRKIRYDPITVEYEVGIFTHKNTDNLYMQHELMWDYSNETVFEPIIEIDSIPFTLPAVLDFDINYEPTYTQSDWLQQNKIHSIELSYSIQTFMLKDNYNVTIPETVIVNFLQNKNISLEEGDTYTALTSLLTDDQLDFEKS